ncbi:MAG: SH3-like domain-containing protein [Pseudomonadota bacterium]
MSVPAVDTLPFDPPYPAGAPRFAAGQAVRVRPGAAPGHIRTPWYLRGKPGVIERICGAFGNPEELAYRRRGGDVPLYRVRFFLAEVWGEAERPDDSIDAEIFEHWLEEA